MPGKAKKIKIRVRKGRWFVLTLPALSFNFLKSMLHFGLKFIPKETKHYNIEEIDFQDLAEDLDLLFEKLAGLEPFVLVEVQEETENVYVKIQTL